MADPTTTNKALAQPVIGSDVGVWGPPMNNNTSVIDNSFGGSASVTLGLSNVVLNSAQYQCSFITLNGALGTNVAVVFPPIGSFYTIINNTTNSSAFYVTALTTVAGGRVVGLPPGDATEIMIDGTNVRFRSMPPVGNYWDYGGSSSPAWNDGCTVPPWLYCNGTTFSSASYPVLANLFGGTTLPDFRGRGPFYLNDGTSRIQSSIGGLDGNTLFATGGAPTVTLSSAHLPNTSFAVTDPGHNHSVTHNANTGTTGPIDASTPGNIGNHSNSSISLNPAFTGITVNTGGSGVPITTVPPWAAVGIRLVRAG